MEIVKDVYLVRLFYQVYVELRNINDINGNKFEEKEKNDVDKEKELLTKI